MAIKKKSGKKREIASNKIGTKIVLLVIISSFVMTAVLGGISIVKSRSAMVEDAESLLLEKVKIYSKDFDEDLVRYETTAKSVHRLIEGTMDKSRLREEGYIEEYIKNTLTPVLKQVAEQTEKSAGVYVVFDPKYTGSTEGVWAAVDGGKSIQLQPSEISGIDPKDPSVAFYYDAINAGKAKWGEFYNNDAGVDVMSYAIPIEYGSDYIGMIGIDLKVTEILNQVQAFEIYETGYAGMLSKDYKSISSHVNEKENPEKSVIIEQLFTSIEEDQAGILDLEFENNSEIVAYSKLYDGKIVLLVAPVNEVLARAKSLTLTIAVSALIIMILVAGLALLLSRRITGPLLYATEILEETSRLDLSNKYDSEEDKKIEQRKDEVGGIFRASQTLRKELRNLVESIEETTEVIINSTGSLKSATNETTQSINDVASTVEEVAEASSNQAREAEDGSRSIGTLAEKIKEALIHSSVVIEASNKSKDLNEEGSQSMEDLLEKFNVSNTYNQEVSNNVDKLADNSKMIEDILDSILGIANQTNLLALNAAIEAARAGEAGRGFAVVADEIRGLSRQTEEATRSVEEILKNIHAQVGSTKDSTDLSKEALNEANKKLDLVNKVFQENHSQILMSIDAISELEGKLGQVDEHKEGAIVAIQNISAVTQETAASTEEVAASMEEQATIIENISDNVDDLGKTIDQLGALVGRFKI